MLLEDRDHVLIICVFIIPCCNTAQSHMFTVKCVELFKYNDHLYLYDFNLTKRRKIGHLNHWACGQYSLVITSEMYPAFSLSKSKVLNLGTLAPFNTWGTSLEIIQWVWFYIKELLRLWLQPILDLIIHGKYCLPIDIFILNLMILILIPCGFSSFNIISSSRWNSGTPFNI